MCLIVKTANNIWIYKTTIVAVMVLSLASSMAFLPQVKQKVMASCASSENQENDVTTLAVSVYTSNQSSTVTLNFKFSDDSTPLLLGIKNSECITSLSNQFNLSLSKYFLVLVRRIVSPNAP